MAVSLVCVHFHAIRYIVTVTPFIVISDVATDGVDVDVLPPYGRYHRFLDERGLDDHGETRPIVVFAGGIGITPLLPIIFRYGYGRRPVKVMYCAHDEAGLLCCGQLEAWSRRTGNPLTLKVGRFTVGELQSAVTPGAIYLIAGPTGMTHAVKRTLRKTGVSVEDICHEPFAW
ncbi:hypothetical protein BSD967_08955 [Bifidobacterium saguini]|uniref:Uncharacterized protein n=1 Tax=Bifidobacterium saguini TaxID=762210 RepID=A0ABX7SBC3_9BIFI|nr:hypothetical protein [Bifidobacterium saguini]QTB90444.1 hypothetical protein BSD967_08955 [Bifidobacterium saguini]